jgi:hypothetical protein
VDRPERWRDNWRAVSPPAATFVELGRSRAALASAREQVAALAPGSPVVLAASAPGARRRCRAFARATTVRLAHDYLAFPSAAMPAYLVENDAGPVRTFMVSALVPPPRARLAPVFQAGVLVLRALGRRRLMSALAPGRVMVGWRS